LISDLEAEIQRLKQRAARQKVTRAPAIKHTTNAVKAIDTAMATSDDAVLRRALDEARSTLVACLAVQGVLIPAGTGKVRRGTHDKSQLADAVLAHVREHGGQRGEQLAAALNVDTKALRPAVRKLIEERKVKTQGQRRGMTYHAA
jgi:hypothetical protein